MRESKTVELLNIRESLYFLACIDMHIPKMSDFERFAFVCQNLHLMIGSDLRKNFLSFMREEIGEEIDLPSLYDREVQKKAWRRLYGEAHTIFTEKKDREETIVDLSDRSSPLLLNSLLERSDLPMELVTLISSLPQEIAVDISSLMYSRPDQYHSNLSYKKLLSGEIVEGEELCALLIWITCRGVMGGVRTVYIVADRDLSQTRRLLVLLEDRGLVPDVRLCFCPDNEEIVHSVANICLSSKKKNISSEIIITEESFDMKYVEALFSRLPITRVKLFDNMSCDGAKEKLDALVKRWAAEK